MQPESPVSPPTNSGDERRCWVRHAVNLDTLYQPGKGQVEQKWMMARVHNIASGGIAIVLDRRFETGTLLALTLLGAQDSISRTLHAHVIHAEPYQDNQWLLGCTFSGILSDEELQALLSDKGGAESS